MKNKTKLVLIFSIVVVVAGIIFFPSIKSWMSGEETFEGPANRQATAGNARRGGPLPVNALIIKTETLLDEIRANTATLYPDEEVDMSFEMSGKITGIYFTEGAAVKRGALIAKINDKPLQAQLQKLEAQIPLAKDRVERHRALLAREAVSKEAYEQVTTELDKLNADIALVQAQIAQTELRAPFDGHLGLRHVSEGAYVSTSTIISTLTKTIPLKVEFSINEKFAASIKVGSPITFTVEGDQNEYSASIYALESTIDPETYTRRVRALYPNAGGRLFPGRSAAIRIRANEIPNAIAVPTETVVKEQGSDIVYVYRSGKAARVELTAGMRTASQLQVVEGLNVGDTLLTSGVMQLRDGMPVTIDQLQ